MSEPQILPDPHVANFIREYANEYFQQAAAPFYKLKAEIHALHAKPYLVVDDNGKVIEHGVRLDPEAQTQIGMIDDQIQLCRDMAVKSAMQHFHADPAGYMQRPSP